MGPEAVLRRQLCAAPFFRRAGDAFRNLLSASTVRARAAFLARR